AMASSYYTEIGKLLINAREDLRLTLPQASSALHIRAHYLHALEVGELSELPGMAYTKGYLQSYAAFLHLDKDEIIRRFELVDDDLPENNLFFPKVFSKEKKASNTIVWICLLFAVATYLIWFFMFRPESTTFSMITQPPDVIKREVIVFDSVLNLACATPEVRVYPACYRANMDKTVENSLLPMHRQINSVMELAY
ncbi:MAG: helix-turn-helix domain-containing protein, partial [Rickettsiales bacterium]